MALNIEAAMPATKPRRDRSALIRRFAYCASALLQGQEKDELIDVFPPYFCQDIKHSLNVGFQASCRRQGTTTLTSSKSGISGRVCEIRYGRDTTVYCRAIQPPAWKLPDQLKTLRQILFFD